MIHLENRSTISKQIFPQTEFHQIERMLQRAGKMQEQRRLHGFQLTVIERETVLEGRKLAQLFGLSMQMIFAIEDEGAKAVRS